MGLITNAYAQAALAELGLTTAQLATLDTVIDAASATIERYCRRKFARATYDQIYQSGWEGTILLQQYPINAISRVSWSKEMALRIVNTDTSTNQRATVAFDFPSTADFETGLTAQGLKLVRVASAVTSTSTLSFGTYTTLQTLEAAINAIGNGWGATVSTGYEKWATTELVGAEGAQGCLDSFAELDVFSEDLSGFRYVVKRDAGIIQMRGRARREYYAFQDDRADLAEWGQVRVVYDAGYQTIPSELQDATAETVKNTLLGLAVNPFVSAEAAGQYSFSFDFRDKGVRLTEAVKTSLAPFRDLRA